MQAHPHTRYAGSHGTLFTSTPPLLSPHEQGNILPIRWAPGHLVAIGDEIADWPAREAASNTQSSADWKWISLLSPKRIAGQIESMDREY